MEVDCDICFGDSKKTVGIHVRGLKDVDFDCNNFDEIERKMCILIIM